MTDFCRVFFLGDSKSGKTAIINKLAGRPYQGYRMSLGLPKTWIKHNEVSFEILENPGNDAFSSNSRLFYLAAQLMVIVFSLSTGTALDGIDRWLSEIRRFARPNVPVVLLGVNEGRREVTYEQASSRAQTEGMIYLEVRLDEELNKEEVLGWLYTQTHP